MEKGKIKWLSSRECDFCHSECKETLYDAATVFGCWATMCESCFNKNGRGSLGLGLGQKYQKDGNDFVKVQG